MSYRPNPSTPLTNGAWKLVKQRNLKYIFLSIPLTLRYGVLLATALLLLKILEFNVYSYRLGQNLYSGILALLFLLHGIGVTLSWLKLGRKLPSNETPSVLTAKEQKLLSGLAEGLTNQQLADRSNTIKTHLKNVYRKLAVANRN